MIAALALAAALASAPAAGCVAETGAFEWGFKESFRAYISGSIANGAWTTEGGIGYATPAFFAERLEGPLALDPLAGTLAVDGALRFTGHEGILDTTISDVRIVVENPDTLSVVVDIRGTTQDFVPVDSVDVRFLTGDLAAAQWKADGQTLLIEGIPLALTAEGAAAFGTYPEGEAFDPLDLALTTSEECAASALEARSAGETVPLLVAAGVIAGGVAIGAVLAVLLRRRRATMGT